MTIKGPGRYCPKCGKFAQKVIKRNPKFSDFFSELSGGETYHCLWCNIVFRVTVENLIDGEIK